MSVAGDGTKVAESQAEPQVDETPEAQAAPELDEAMPKPEADDLSPLAALEAELAEQADEEEALDEGALAGPCWTGELPESLTRIVEARIDIWKRLMDLDELRSEIRDLCRISEIQSELSRQNRELKRIPSGEVLRKSLQRLRKKLETPTLSNRAPIPNPKKGAPPINPVSLYQKTLKVGGNQAVMFLKREGLDDKIPGAAEEAFKDEPLYQVCQAHDIDASTLLGWTYYALGVQQRLDVAREREQAHHERLSDARAWDKKNNSGLKSIFGGRSKVSEVPPLDAEVMRTMQAARRELQAIEPKLTDLFWAFYEELAWLMVSKDLGEDELLVVRAFMRYGMVSVHPGLTTPEVLDYIRDHCRSSVYQWTNSVDATHIVYADEYIEGIMNGHLPVSPDEDLALNGRNTDEWKADRVYRQATISKIRQEVFESRFRELQATIQAKQDELQAKQKELKELKASGKHRARAAELDRELAMERPQLGRLVRAAEHIESKSIPRAREQAEDAGGKLKEAAGVLSREALTRREARFVRRMARLAARLKEPFPQFVLRDHFKPDRAEEHDRQTVLEGVQAMEEADTRVFHYTLAPNKVLARQITVRLSPTFLIVPGRGQMGLSVSPRKWDDNGRFVLPFLPHRQGILQTLLISMLADFRWDCSKEDAGMDWLTADALCAAYATARWNCRKASEKAQKSMGMDRKLKDKPNWRIHYRLYIKSAAEQGRLLFVRSYEVYKIVMKYIGLPPGQMPLKRD